MPPHVEDSGGSIKQLANLWRWFILAEYMKRGRLISLRRKPSLLLVILLRRLSRASSRYSTRINQE
jgi:hypothetical protein